MSTALSRSALLSIVLLAGCEPALFTVELDIPDACLEGIDVTFPPSSLAALASDPLSYTDMAAGLPDDLELDIEVLEIGLRATNGVDDLSFVDRMAVRMQPLDPSAQVAAMSLLEMSAADHQDDGTMRRAFEQPVDITNFLTVSDALFAFDVAGEPQTSEWQGSMDLCVHTVARYKKDF